MLVELGKSKSLTYAHFPHNHSITNAGIDALVKGCGYKLEHLNFLDCPALTDASLSSISEHCPNLQSICLGDNHQDMTLDAMINLTQKCEKLIYFTGHDTLSEQASNYHINSLMVARVRKRRTIKKRT